MTKAWGEFRKYLFEVLAIITAITLSFLFDEWREKRKDRRDNVALLAAIADNLKQDTMLLARTIEFEDKLIAGEKHILTKPDSLKADSLVLGMLAFQSYPTFRKTDIAYLTMLQTGQSKVVTNKKLLAGITELYQYHYPLIDEWTEIERRFVLDKTIPYINSNLPFVKNYNYGSLMGKNQRFTTALRSDEFRNLLNTDYNFKSALKVIYTSTQKQVDSLMKEVNAELKKLQ